MPQSVLEMATTLHYIRDQDGNWRKVSPGEEPESVLREDRSIKCKVCDQGAMERRHKFRMSGPVVVIGFILLIPSLIGMVIATVVLITAGGIGASSNDARAGTAIFAIGGGIASVVGISSFVGGLIGWLLVMRRWVLQCSFCGALINVSAPPVAYAPGKIGLLVVLFGILAILNLSNGSRNTAKSALKPQTVSRAAASPPSELPDTASGDSRKPPQAAADSAEPATAASTPDLSFEAVARGHNESKPELTALPNRPAAYAVAQEFSVGYWTYRCNRVAWTSTLGSGFTSQKANAAFLVIDVTVRNNDKSASTLPPFYLMDAEGRKYDESSDVTLQDGFFNILEKLNPDLSKEGLIAFDVPYGRRYFLLVSGGFESTEKALVVIPQAAEAGGVNQ
jgi:hypothetical protein